MKASHRILLGAVLTAFALSSLTNCRNGGNRGTSGGAEGDDPAENPNGDSKDADAIVADTLARAEVFTKETVDGSCLKVSFSVTSKGAPYQGAEIVFSISPKSSMTEPGTVGPDKITSDAEGKASTNYCGGKDEGTVSIVAKAGGLSSNTGEIKVRRKPLYEFKWTRSDAKIVQTAQNQGTGSANDTVIPLNVIDSGPNDCTLIYFELKKSGQPVVGETVRFRTQVDPPKGAKLAKKKDAGVTDIEANTNKKFLYFDATSSSTGEFPIPVCSGVELGTLLITGIFTDTEEQKQFVAQSPVISISAGVTNYFNLSLTFDKTNGRVLEGYFNTNSDKILPVTAKLGARRDGDPISDYPISVYSETGKIRVANGGFPSGEEGTVNFTVQPLHMVDYRPYPVTTFLDRTTNVPISDAETRCDAYTLTTRGTSDVTYAQLSKNWRSTSIYLVRGAEAYNDANANGSYDEGGDGFWDKNQNGVYDSGDVLTKDVGDNGFDRTGEWFIDLPSPFIDVDENGSFDSAYDILIGDVYVAPNGKRDADATIWKYEYFPIYMGTSFFAMTRGIIKKDAFSTEDITTAKNFYSNLSTLGLRRTSKESNLFTQAYTLLDMFGTATPLDPLTPANDNTEYRNSVDIWRHFYGHGVCGSPLPGGATVRVDLVPDYTSLYGIRVPTAHFFTQPGDFHLEPSRRYLKEATGKNTATINFNAVETRGADSGYPIEFNLAVPPCVTICTGKVLDPGYACDAVLVTSDNHTMSAPDIYVPSVITCTCQAGATLKGSDCAAD